MPPITFNTTHWSVVLAAKGDNTRAHAALRSALYVLGRWYRCWYWFFLFFFVAYFHCHCACFGGLPSLYAFWQLTEISARPLWLLWHDLSLLLSSVGDSLRSSKGYWTPFHADLFLLLFHWRLLGCVGDSCCLSNAQEGVRITIVTVHSPS